MTKNILIDYKNRIQSKKIVIVYFYSNECIKTNEVYKSIITKKSNVLFLSYNVEENKNKKLIESLDVKIYPYFYIYKNGVMIDQILGTLNVYKILSQYVST
jgi:hypothetical protein